MSTYELCTYTLALITVIIAAIELVIFLIERYNKK